MSAAVSTHEAVEVTVVTSPEGLEEHAQAWDRLAVSAPERLPMLSHAWVSSFLEHCNPGGAPWWCLFAYRAGELVGVLPLLHTPGRFGRRLAGPVDSHTDTAHPLLAGHAASEALAALLAASHELDPRSCLRWSGVRDSSPLLPALAGLGAPARVLQPPPYLGSFVDTAAGFEEFQARLSSSFRRSMRSARRKAEKEHGLEFERVTGAEAARPELLAEFLRVEASGWKGANGSAIACHPDRIAFYTALTQRLARRGWLEWNLERFDGSVVAAHLAVRFGPALVLPKGGYDETHARLQPGNLLFWEVFTRCFADEAVHEVNFLTAKPWMAIWKMERSTYHDLVLARRRPAATLRGLLEVAEPRRRASGYVHARPELLRRVEEAQRRVEQARRWAAVTAGRDRHGSTRPAM